MSGMSQRPPHLPFAPADPPPPGPGQRRFGSNRLVVLAVAAALLGIGVAFLASRSKHEVAASPSPPPATSHVQPVPPPSASPPKSQSPAMSPFTLSGSLYAGTKCPPFPFPIMLTVLDQANEELGWGMLPLDQHGNRCVGEFSFDVEPADRLTLLLEVTGGEGSSTLFGPTFTMDELAKQDYHVSLSGSDFAENSYLLEANSELAKALHAASGYFNDHGTFVGLDAAEMHALVPSVTFNDSKRAVTGETSVRQVTDETILFVSGLPDGTPYCRGMKPPRQGSYGYTDAQTYDECLRWHGTYPTPSTGPPV